MEKNIKLVLIILTITILFNGCARDLLHFAADTLEYQRKLKDGHF